MLFRWHDTAFVQSARISALWSSHTKCVGQAVPADVCTRIYIYIHIIKTQRHRDEKKCHSTIVANYYNSIGLDFSSRI